MWSLHSCRILQGFCGGPGGLRLEKFVEDEVVLIAGTNPTFRNYQRLAAAAATAEDLYRLRLIWRESGSGTRAIVEGAMRKLGVQTKRLAYQHVLADIEAIKTAVIHCMGFAFLSDWIAPETNASMDAIRAIDRWVEHMRNRDPLHTMKQQAFLVNQFQLI
jgi:DNA-binding transcriptional LysR family regulator